MKTSLLILLATALSFPTLSMAQLKPTLVEDNGAPPIQHAWTYGAAQFTTDEENIPRILADSATYLRAKGFTPGEIPENSEELADSLCFTKLYEKRGRIIIELRGNGIADLTVESYQSMPQRARFRAEMLLEYKPFALWMDLHPMNLTGQNTKHLAESIDKSIAALQKKADGAE